MMEWNNFLRWLELYYTIDINSELRNTLEEHFGESLDIYTEQDLYEQSRKIIQNFKYECINTKYYRYRKYL